MWVDADHGDGTANPFPRHIKQEQALLLLLLVVAGVGKDDDEVEAVVEAGREPFAVPDAGGARPPVRAGDAVQEPGRGGDEAAGLAGGAVARRVRERAEVLLVGVVRRHGGAAVGRVGARRAEGVDRRRAPGGGTGGSRRPTRRRGIRGTRGRRRACRGMASTARAPLGTGRWEA